MVNYIDMFIIFKQCILRNGITFYTEYVLGPATGPLYRPIDSGQREEGWPEFTAAALLAHYSDLQEVQTNNWRPL